jgi:hypothetical protein
VLESPEGSLSLLLGGLLGVIAIACRAVAEASDIGGEGGVGAPDTEAPVEIDFVSGGVVIMGEDEAELRGESLAGELGAVMSVAIGASCRFRSLSCMISASILRSDSSSRSR